MYEKVNKNVKCEYVDKQTAWSTMLEGWGFLKFLFKILDRNVKMKIIKNPKKTRLSKLGHCISQLFTQMMTF